jgi:hypothetical protein
MVEDVRAAESEDPVNYRIAQGKLTAVELVEA